MNHPELENNKNKLAPSFTFPPSFFQVGEGGKPSQNQEVEECVEREVEPQLKVILERPLDIDSETLRGDFLVLKDICARIHARVSQMIRCSSSGGRGGGGGGGGVDEASESRELPGVSCHDLLPVIFPHLSRALESKNPRLRELATRAFPPSEEGNGGGRGDPAVMCHMADDPWQGIEFLIQQQQQQQQQHNRMWGDSGSWEEVDSNSGGGAHPPPGSSPGNEEELNNTRAPGEELFKSTAATAATRLVLSNSNPAVARVAVLKWEDEDEERDAAAKSRAQRTMATLLGLTGGGGKGVEEEEGEDIFPDAGRWASTVRTAPQPQ